MSEGGGVRAIRGVAIGLLVLGLLGQAGCGHASRPLTHQSVGRAFDAQLQRARRALDDEQWLAAQEQLHDLTTVLPVSDPTGAEAHRMLAIVQFELGDYPDAIVTAATLADTSADALEVLGLANLFMCQFDQAEQAFYSLATIDEARGRVWLGVAYAWAGAHANAERELEAVVAGHGATEAALNARFYLAQLAFWDAKDDVGRTRLQELATLDPNYLPRLGQRAQNWLGRETHLMRAYFTFDTLSRADGIVPASPWDAPADRAMATLAGRPNACSQQIQRLASARAQFVAGRTAEANRLASLESAARAELERQTRDSDGDGVIDIHDGCPTEPETFNALDDADGCPEATAAIEVVGGQIRVRAGFAVYFAPGQSDVLDESSPVLAGVAAVLMSPAYAWIRRLRLDGHTDDSGDADTNLRLSELRVRSVGAALIARGVDPSRLDVAFFGESRPIDLSGTEQAQARNRRVEFIITEPVSFGGVRY